MVTVVLPDKQTLEMREGFTEPELKAAIMKLYDGKAPDYVKQYQKEQKEMLDQRLGEIGESIRKKTPGFIFGAGDALGNFERNMLNVALPKGMQFGKAQTVPEDTPGYQGGEVAGDIASFMFGGGPAFQGLKAASKLPYAGAALGKLVGERFLPSLARRGLGTGAYMAIQNPENRMDKAVQGAAMSGLVDTGFATVLGAPGAVRAGARKLRDVYQKRAEGTFGPEYRRVLRERLKAAEGSQTPLGDVLRDPFLKRTFENYLAHETGYVHDTRSAMKKDLTDKLDDVFKGWRTVKGKEVLPEHIDQKIKEGLEKAYEKQRQAKIKLYKDVNKLTEKENFHVDLEKTNKVFDKVSGDLDKLGLIKSYRERSDVFKAFEKVLKPKEKEPEKTVQILDQYGIPFKSTAPPRAEQKLSADELSLVNLKTLATDLRTMARSIGEKGEGHHAVDMLSNALRSDIKESVKKLGPAAKKALEKADKNYAQKFAPYLDREVKKILMGATEPSEIVSKFVKKGSGRDAVEQLQKITKVLDKDTLNLLKHKFFAQNAGAMENLLEGTNIPIYTSRPDKFAASFKNALGTNQKKALFNPQERQKLGRLVDRIGMNPVAASEEAFKKAAVVNGQALREMIKKMGVVPALGASVVAPKAVAGYFTVLMAKKFGERQLAKLLTNERVREFAVKQITSSIPHDVGSKGIKEIRMALQDFIKANKVRSLGSPEESNESERD